MPVTDETFRRIAAARADRGQGRVVDAIDYDADAVAQRHRSRVHIELRQYDPHFREGGADAKQEAERTFRAELERAMRGPEKVVMALQAWELGQTGSISSLTREEQALAVLWPKAMERAVAAGRRGLADVAGAWFEVLLKRPAPPPPPPFNPLGHQARAPMASVEVGTQRSLF